MNYMWQKGSWDVHCVLSYQTRGASVVLRHTQSHAFHVIMISRVTGHSNVLILLK